jgi:hypothetical protein
MCKKQFSSFSNKYLALSMSSWIINQSESIDTNTYYCSVSFWTFENLVYEVPQKKNRNSCFTNWFGKEDLFKTLKLQFSATKKLIVEIDFMDNNYYYYFCVLAFTSSSL